MENKTYTLDERIEYYKRKIEKYYNRGHIIDHKSIEFLDLLRDMARACHRLEKLTLEKYYKENVDPRTGS